MIFRAPLKLVRGSERSDRGEVLKTFARLKMSRSAPYLHDGFMKHEEPDLTALAKELRRNATPAEQIMWQRLRNRKLGGFKFYRQYVIKDFIVDFLCKDAMLIVEIDGEYHHDDVQQTRDQHRDVGLGVKGYRVLRISNSDVLSQTDAVCDRILDALYNNIESLR